MPALDRVRGRRILSTATHPCCCTEAVGANTVAANRSHGTKADRSARSGCFSFPRGDRPTVALDGCNSAPNPTTKTRMGKEQSLRCPPGDGRVAHDHGFDAPRPIRHLWSYSGAVSERITYDIYGRFRVRAEQTVSGEWLVYRLGAEGKRSRLFDVVVEDDAEPSEIERQLEAVYHELGSPGTSIRPVDL